MERAEHDEYVIDSTGVYWLLKLLEVVEPGSFIRPIHLKDP